MNKVIKLKNWEKIVLRIFAAWCIATICVSIPVREQMYNLSSVEQINTNEIVLYMIGIFGLVTLADTLASRYIKDGNWSTDVIVYSISVIAFGINSVLSVTDPYLAAIVVFGVSVCLFYPLKRYGFILASKDISRKKMLLVVVLIALFTFLLVGTLTVLRYKLYKTATFDFGIFCQMFYNMKKNFLPITTCERNELLSHFAVHVSPIFYLILPIYYIFPYNETLIIVQLLFIISGVIPLVLICKNRNMKNTITTALATAYLLSPVLFGGLLYDFHENKFLTTLILWMMYFVEKNKKIGMLIFTVLILMVKEDAGIYAACIGLYIIVTKKKVKDKAYGLLILLMSIGWFLIAYSWLNSGGDGAMTGRYDNYIVEENGSVFGIITTIFKNPAYFFEQLLDQEKLKNLLWVVVPVMFMPFRIKTMKELILLIPLLVINLMPDYVYQYNVSHQYYYGSFALMLYLVIANMKEKRKFENSMVAIYMAVASMIMFTSFMSKSFGYIEEYVENKDYYEQIQDVLDAIPDDASVSVTTYMMPNVSMRDEVYRYPAGEGCDYIVYDLTSSSASSYLAESEKFLSNGYNIIDEIEGAILVIGKNN